METEEEKANIKLWIDVLGKLKDTRDRRECGMERRQKWTSIKSKNEMYCVLRL